MMSLAMLMMISSPVMADPVSYSGNTSRLTHSNNLLTVCDNSADGNRGYAQAETRGGARWTVTDTRGADPYCNRENPSNIGSAHKHRTCEKGNGCSRWNSH